MPYTTGFSTHCSRSRHYSSVLKRWLPKSDYEEFPSSWFTNLEVNRYLTAKEYDERVNRYRVKAGQSLNNWEASGWVHEQDPRGWIQWYFRFYLGRRSDDDDRQIKRCKYRDIGFFTLK